MTATQHEPVAERQPPPDWVPVERRLWGVDKRTLLPAAVVVLLVVVAVWVLPTLNTKVAVDDPIRAGDVIQLGDVATFVPPVGWNLLAGERQGEPGVGGLYPTTAAVTDGGTVVQVEVDDFDGTPRELLEQIRKTDEELRGDAALRVTGTPAAIVTDSGEHGVIARLDSTRSDGAVAAFVHDGSGIEVLALGRNVTAQDTVGDVRDLIESIAPVEQEQTP